MRYEAVFIPTVEDTVTGFHMHNRQRNDVWKLYLLAGVGVTAVFGIAGWATDIMPLGLLGLGLSVLAVVSPWLSELNLRFAARKMKREELRLSFSEEGIELVSPNGQMKHTWALVVKASLDERGILLYTEPLKYFFVPARAFVSGYFPREELKALLAAKLRKT